MSKLLVCEKLHPAQDYLPLLEDGDAIIIAPATASYLFDYPDDLRFADLPYKSELPIYKERNTTNYTTVSKTYFLTKDGNTKSVLLKDYQDAKQGDDLDLILNLKSKVHDLIGSFDEIIYACDQDHTGMRGFDFHFQKYLGIENLAEFASKYDLKVTAVYPDGFYTDAFREALSNTEDFFTSKTTNFLREVYLRKDFFDYNYICNSLLLINKAYYLAFDVYPDIPITRNMISAVFLVEKNKCHTARIIKKMTDLNLGSPVSRGKLLESLVDLGIIIEDEQEIILTEKGSVFISHLHRKLNDPYLATRLSIDTENKEISFEDFRNKYIRYLETVFSKQKRYINKLM